MALHMRIHDVGRDGLKKLIDGPVSLAAWESLLDSCLARCSPSASSFFCNVCNTSYAQELGELLRQTIHDILAR